MRRSVTLCATALAFFTASGALAQQDRAAAANAFSRAQKAALAGDYAQAAEMFELADSLAPAPEALRSAVSARREAGQLATAAAGAEQLKARYPDDPESKKLASEVLTRARKELGWIIVTCAPAPCQVEVDQQPVGASAEDRHVVYLKPGSHDVVAVFGRRRSPSRSLKTTAGAEQTLEFSRPAAEEEPKPESTDKAGSVDVAADSGAGSDGLPPWVFGTAVGVTVVLAGVATWSGLDTLSERDSYDENRTRAGFERGLDLERRTNILFAATGVAAAATLTLGLFTDFGGKEQASGPRVGVAKTRGGAAMSLSGSF